MRNDVRNSLSSWLLPCHSLGMIPRRKSSPAGLRVENVSASSMTPCPHGDADAARNEDWLYCNKYFSISLRSMIVSHSVGPSGCIVNHEYKSMLVPVGDSSVAVGMRGIMMCFNPPECSKKGFAAMRICRNMSLLFSVRMVAVTIFFLRKASGLASSSYLTSRSS